MNANREMIGTTLSHFKITAKLGEGGMGEVYRAEDLELRRTVALKVLPDEFACNEERLQRFRREAQALAALDHPNIVAIHSIDEADGVRFFTMQHVDGEELCELIPETGLELERFFNVAIPLADALAAAHDRGIVHRDLKPANVMVDRDGRVRVLDFGLAKLCQEKPGDPDSQLGTELLTQEGRILGTVAYMSPEQAQGRPLDARSDIFSLGVILHEMATGSRPFGGDNQVAMLSSLLKDTPSTVTEIKPELPRHLSRIVRHALEKDPERRFQSAKDLLNELGDLKREADPGEAQGEAAVPAERLERRRNRGPLYAAAALGVLALALAGLNVDKLLDRREVADEPPGAKVASTSIAVIPFENLSPDPDNEYFSDGMTHELVSKLSRIQSFRVRSTPLGWSRGDQQRVQDIGEELGVQYVLEGSVRRAGSRVRITVLLVDTSSAYYLWSQEFDGELEDVFAVQEETALQIAEALNVELSAEEDEAVRGRYTENPAAYDAYLRGWALIESFHIHQDRPAERLEAAEKHFARALQLDEDYPLALSGLAMVEAYTYYFDVNLIEAHLDQAEELGQRALALHPGLPEALAALGLVSWNRQAYAESAERLRQALRRAPDNGYVWCELAAACNNQDPPDGKQAEEAARKAIQYQPGYTFAHANLGWALSHQGRHEEAIPAFRHALELDPEFRFGYVGLGGSHLALGEYIEALASYESARELAESADILVDIAIAHAALGDREGALGALEEALALGFDDYASLHENPNLAEIRENPKFEAMLATRE